MTTTATTNTIEIAAAIITVSAAGNVKAARTYDTCTTPTRDADGCRLGRVFPDPDGAGIGYVTAAGVESPSWYADVDHAASALTSRGVRGSAGKNRPSDRWDAAFAAVTRKRGATRPQILDAIEAATGVRMAAYLVANLVSDLRRPCRANDDTATAITYDRASGTYTAA